MPYRIAFAAFAVLATPALAATDLQQFEQDRKFAERSITRAEQKVCLDDFSSKIAHPASLKPAGKFQFNKLISRGVYEKLYWNGGNRGVAFTLPVTMSDKVMGETAGNLACFYALTDSGIRFQHSQPLNWRPYY
jgi:hypothetical protein